MNSIQIFNNPEFGEVRTLEINGEAWFVGKDVAEILGYADPQKAVKAHVDDDDKLTRQIVVSGQNRNVTVISESGLYSLILFSKMPDAFQALDYQRSTSGYSQIWNVCHSATSSANHQ